MIKENKLEDEKVVRMTYDYVFERVLSQNEEYLTKKTK